MRFEGNPLTLIAGCALVGLVLLFSALSLFDEDFIPLLLLFLFIAPAVWTLLHALINGVPNAFFWAMLALFANVIGMIVYTLCQGRPGTRACPACQESLSARFRWCPWCGRKMGD
jgi:hypothetical protein